MNIKLYITVNAKNNKIILLLISFFLFQVIPSSAFCQEINLRDSVPFNPAAKKNILPNGFSYYLSRNNIQPGKIFIKLDVKAGVFQQEKDQTEVAHVMEHIAFRSSPHFPEDKSFKEYLKASGVTFYNAHPNTECITFYFEIPADTIIAEQLFLAFQDWLSGKAMLTNEIIASEKKIVAAEIMQRGMVNYMNAACQLLKPSRFSENYKAMDPNDFITKINTLSPAAVRRFYYDWYRPDLAGLFIVGDMDVAIMERIVIRKFDSLLNPVPERPHTNYPIKVIGSNKFITDIRSDREDQSISIEMFFLRDWLAKTTYLNYKETALIELFDNMLKHRLEDLSQIRKGQLLTPLYGGVNNNGLYGLLSLRVQSLNFTAHCDHPEAIETGLKALFTEVERVKQYGFSERELDSTRSELLAALPATSGEELSKEADRYSDHFMYGELAPSVTVLRQLRKKFLNEITLKEINHAAVAWINAKNRSIVIRAPETARQYIPNETTALSWWKTIQDDTLPVYTISLKKEEDVKVDFDSLYSLPAPGTYNRHDFTKSDITELQLANGVRVIIKPAVSATSNWLYIKGIRPVGASGYIGAKYLSAYMAPKILQEAGLGELNKEELDVYSQKRNIGMQAEINDLESTIGGSAPGKELETLLQLTYRYFLIPREDSAAYAFAMDKFYQKPNRRNFVSKELTSLVGYQIKLKKYPWLSLKELHTINYNLCQEIYKVHFSHPQEFTFVITGCQDREKTISLVAKYLGNLPIRKEHPVPPAKVGSTKPGFTIHKTIVNENLKKGRAEVFIYYTGYHSFSLKERIKQGILVKIVEAACFRRLREKESGIYSLYADLYRQKRPVSDEPGWYELQIMFVCNPGISERLIKTTEEEIELLKKNGPEKNDFNAVLDYFKQNGLSSKLNDLMWQTLLLDCYRNKESFDDISDLAAFVESIRPEDIRQIAQEYLIKDRFISYTEISK